MSIDLLLAGSPCQGFSRNGNGLNFDDPRSKLFFEAVEGKKALNPKYFLFENVNMKKEWEDVITSYLGVKPIKINSGLVSPQERLRTYWTNIPGVKQPKDRGIFLTDILEDNVSNSYYEFNDHEKGMFVYTLNGMLIRNGTKYKGYLRAKNGDGLDMAMASVIKSQRRGRRHKGKIGTLDTSCKWAIYNNDILRWFSMTELERLQGFSDGYTDGFSDNERKKMIGNAWQVDTTSYILSYLPLEELDIVYSFFDGVSCGQQSLDRCGIKYNNYYASEIDKKAIEVTMNNYPRTMQIGDITKIDWNQIIA